MFCEKCGTQIPDGADSMCANCRARFGAPQQNFAQPQYQQPVQPQQAMYQQPAPKANFSLDAIVRQNAMINLVLRLFFSAFAVWAAFGPLLSYIKMSFFGIGMNFSFMLIASETDDKTVMGFFVPILIFMILSIILSLAGLVLTILPKAAPKVKLPLPSFASYAATACALLFSIVSQFITIGFIGTSGGAASFAGFGVFMMIFSFISLAATVFLALPEFKKK